ncbi:hypothetical protein J5751_03700, partial [bacterium]|nr:hypothetical protein [bacterium]
GEKKCKVRLYKLAQYFPELKDFQTKEDLIHGIINKHNGVTTVNTEQRKNGTDGKVIDFNQGFEQYSARIDSERAERAAQKDVGQPAEPAQPDNERTQPDQPVNTPAVPERKGYTGMSW